MRKWLLLGLSNFMFSLFEYCIMLNMQLNGERLFEL
jgi:hypothetical protein